MEYNQINRGLCNKSEPIIHQANEQLVNRIKQLESDNNNLRYRLNKKTLSLVSRISICTVLLAPFLLPIGIAIVNPEAFMIMIKKYT